MNHRNPCPDARKANHFANGSRYDAALIDPLIRQAVVRPPGSKAANEIAAAEYLFPELIYPLDLRPFTRLLRSFEQKSYALSPGVGTSSEAGIHTRIYLRVDSP